MSNTFIITSSNRVSQKDTSPTMQMQVGAPMMGQQQMFVVPNGGQFVVPQLGAPYGQMPVAVPQQQPFEFQNVMSDEDGDEHSPQHGMAAGGSHPFRHAPPADMNRPCKHNDWDDVRTRKGAKILRCRTCQAKWKLPSAKVPRCTPFLAGHCERFVFLFFSRQIFSHSLHRGVVK